VLNYILVTRVNSDRFIYEESLTDRRVGCRADNPHYWLHYHLV